MLLSELINLETNKMQNLIYESCETIKKDIPKFLHSYYRCIVGAKIVSDEVILLISINDDYLTNILKIDYKNEKEYIDYIPPKELNGFNINIFFYKKFEEYSESDLICLRLEKIFNKKVVNFPMEKMW